jgi:hypothetical protein
MMKVIKVSSAEHLDNLLDVLDKMISIKEYSIKSFQENEISFSLTIFGTEDQFKKSVQTHKDFSIESIATEVIQASDKFYMKHYLRFIPNLIYLVRIFLVIPTVLNLLAGEYIFAWILFAIASIS